MSIIHDALKKVQQSLSPKIDGPQLSSTTVPLYETPAGIETLAPADQAGSQKPPIQNKIKSLLALSCAILIIATSGLYIYQQLKTDIPKVQTFAKKSFYKLIHKEVLPDFKTRDPRSLKPLAQLTISTKSPAPITLDIHGIMANASGNLVLINDQVYQEGDEIDGAKITKINLDSITIINNGIEQTIFVKD